MNENEKNVQNEVPQENLNENEAKETKKSLKVRVGEKLAAGEPLVDPKKIKRGLAIAGGVIGAAALGVVGFLVGQNFGVEDVAEALPEDIPDVIPFDDIPVDEVTEVVNL